MSQKHVSIKVGIFVLFGLILLGALTVLLSRNTAFYGDYYELRLQASNVGGIKSGAKILMRGVPIGNVKATKLNDGGRSVTILLRIQPQYQLYSDARFEIEQAGFLGDQFIAIYPGSDQGYVLTNHAEVVAKAPFNMQEAVAVATEMIMKISQTTTNLNAAVSDIRRLVLTEQKLENVGVALERLNTITLEAEVAMRNLSTIVTNNSQPITAAVSNLHAFTAQLPALTDQINSVVNSNAAGLHMTVQNLETSSAIVTNLLTDLRAGRGAVGRLLRDETLANSLDDIAYNLSYTASNLNVRGLWGIMWKQKSPPPPRTNAPAKDQ